MVALGSITEWLSGHTGLVVGAAIVLVGLFGVGFRDVIRFSPTRTLAVASVCFWQSIRRRVLWITPLVILGVIAVSQFQKPVDAQDEVRQTTAYCLFATGLLLVLVILLLASTNIPHEIDSRVMYTVATKPVTRLEIMLGKIVGFGGVSACILLIMGLFTLGFLQVRDWRLRRAISATLTQLDANHESRRTLEYYRDKGTLHARDLRIPAELSMYAHQLAGPDDRWAPATEGELLVKFIVDRAVIPEKTPAGVPALQLRFNMRAQPARGADREAAATTQATTRPAPASPRVVMEFQNANREAMVERYGIQTTDLPGGHGQATVNLLPKQVQQWIPTPEGPVEVYVAVIGVAPHWEYTAPCVLQRGSFKSQKDVEDAWRRDFVMEVPAQVSPTGQTLRFQPMGVYFGSRRGPYGQQLKGSRDGGQRVAVYQFSGVPVDASRKTYPFELRAGIEADYGDQDLSDMEAQADTVSGTRRSSENLVQVDVLSNRKLVRDIPVHVENNRPAYFDVPAEALGDGNFMVFVRLANTGYLGLRGGAAASLKVAVSDQSVAWNLAKSLSILWLLSLLVAIIALFCSTFLSWPIAVVLTLLILSGHWAVVQLGDMTGPGIGRQIAQDLLKGTGAAKTRAFTESVDQLVKTMNTVSGVLPDISRYAAIEQIQRGEAVDLRVILESLQVTLGYGIPLTVLAFLILKYKEVAP